MASEASYPRHACHVRRTVEAVNALFAPRHVPHLVDLILDMAEYWIGSRAVNRKPNHNPTIVRAFSSKEASTASPFLQTIPINAASSRLPVKKLVVSVTGRCQEWYTNPGDGLGSWYELAKQRVLPKRETDALTCPGELVKGPVLAVNDTGRKRYQVILR